MPVDEQLPLLFVQCGENRMTSTTLCVLPDSQEDTGVENLPRLKCCSAPFRIRMSPWLLSAKH